MTNLKLDWNSRKFPVIWYQLRYGGMKHWHMVAVRLYWQFMVSALCLRVRVCVHRVVQRPHGDSWSLG